MRTTKPPPLHINCLIAPHDSRRVMRTTKPPLSSCLPVAAPVDSPCPRHMCGLRGWSDLKDGEPALHPPLRYNMQYAPVSLCLLQNVSLCLHADNLFAMKRYPAAMDTNSFSRLSPRT